MRRGHGGARDRMSIRRRTQVAPVLRLRSLAVSPAGNSVVRRRSSSHEPQGGFASAVHYRGFSLRS